MEKLEIDPEHKKEIIHRVLDKFRGKYETTFDGNILTFKCDGIVFLEFDLYDFCQRNNLQNMMLFIEQDMFDEMYKSIDVNFKDVFGLTQEEFQAFIACNYVCCEETHRKVIKFIHNECYKKMNGEHI